MSEVCKHWHEYDDGEGYMYEYCDVVVKKCTCGASPQNCNYPKEKECGETDHDWLEIVKPEGNRSGYHVDKCIRCGKMQTYDTSD